MNKTFTLLEISNAVCNYYGISEKQIYKRDKTKPIKNIRHIFFYFCREFSKESLEKIGAYLDNRGHDTVLHSVNLILFEREKYPNVKKDIEGITATLFSAIVIQDIDLLKLTENYSKLFI